MRTSEELYSEVIQLRQTVSQCLEFKRILQKIFDTKDTVTANDSIKKYYPHFQGAHLKYKVYRKIFNEHLSKIEGIDEHHLRKCDETECFVCSLNKPSIPKLAKPISLSVSEGKKEQTLAQSESAIPVKELSPKPVETKSQNNLHCAANLQEVPQKTVPVIPKQPLHDKTEPPFVNTQMKFSNTDSFVNVNCNPNATQPNFGPVINPFFLPQFNSPIVNPYLGGTFFPATKATKRMLSNIPPNESTSQLPNDLNKRPKNVILPSEIPFPAQTVPSKNNNPNTLHVKVIPTKTNSNQGENAPASLMLAPTHNPDQNLVKCRVYGCKLSFRNEDSMKSHCEKDHADSFKCNLCHKQFSNAEIIQQHLKYHKTQGEEV